MQNTIMFIIIVCATFLERVKPVSTSANPACMKKTSTPAIKTHIAFSETAVSATTAGSAGSGPCAKMDFAVMSASTTASSTAKMRVPFD